MQEVIKNVFLEDSVVVKQIPDPDTWLTSRREMAVRYVGGLHNLNHRDKTKWAKEEGEPLRIVETGTGREEIWFGDGWQTPVYASVDADGNLTSHEKFNQPQPSIVQALKQENPVEMADGFISEFMFWHQENVLHREPDIDGNLAPAVTSEKLIFITDSEYIAGVQFTHVSEYWSGGEWKKTTVDDMTIVFRNQNLNSTFVRNRAAEWIGKYCRHGFFPNGNELFGDEEEEFLFVADICA